jgi:hypothetical protein
LGAYAIILDHISYFYAFSNRLEEYFTTSPLVAIINIKRGVMFSLKRSTS